MSHEQEWVDDEAGPVVRPYAVARGRTRSSSTALDLLATVAPTGQQPPPQADLGVQHRRLLACVTEQARPIAEVAAELNLPVQVVRVLLGDLLDHSLVTVRPPRSKEASSPTESLLREVISGLRAL